MTNRKSRATARATETASADPYGMTNKRGKSKSNGKGNGKGNSRFPFGDDKQKSNCNSKSKCDGKLATMGLKRFGIGFGDEHV